MTRRRALTVLALMAAAVYAAMWCGWALNWGWVVGPDESTLAVGRRIGAEHHAWMTFWDAWCTVFSPVTIRVVTLGLIVHALVNRRSSSPGRFAPARRVRVAIFLFVSIELSALLTEVAKRLADRPRPTSAMVDALSTSFPSGHALGTMVAVLALGVVFLPQLRPRLRPWAVAGGIVIVLTVGAGRVALNVHHLSDVVAGWALGYLYFACCLVILRGAGIRATDETPATPDIER